MKQEIETAWFGGFLLGVMFGLALSAVLTVIFK